MSARFERRRHVRSLLVRAVPVALAAAAVVTTHATAVQPEPAAPVAVARPDTTPTTAPRPTATAAATPATTAVATPARPRVAPPRAVSPSRRRVLLTFDDGPHPTYTPQVLALLAEHRVQAAFCLVGQEVRRFRHLVRDISRAGHLLCNHSTDHDMQLARRAPAAAQSDLAETSRLVAAAAGRRPTLFRAPGGRWADHLERSASGLGMTSLRWTVDPRDWTRPGAGAIASVVLREAEPGSVVLLHDGGGDRSQTVEALEVLLPRLAAKGLLR